MSEVAAHEPMSVEELDAYRRAGLAWVVVLDGEPVAYIVMEVVDSAAHVEQVSVDPAFARQRLGRRLLEHVAGEARAEGRTAVTLTTYREVPWNAPYYSRCGFRVLEEAELGPELRAKRDAETAHGLDPTLRVCMRRDL